MVTVKIIPDDEIVTFPKLNTVMQLMNKLNLYVNDALIIRDGKLLTPDDRIGRDDEITVRMVVSKG